MPSPFPGMDPYLEAPATWPDFHERLGSEISSELNQTLPTPYYALLQMRPEVGVVEQGKARQRIVPDIAAVRHPLRQPSPGATAVLDRPRRNASRSLDITVPDYLVLVNRAWQRADVGMGYQVFPSSLRAWLPCIPVPLKPGESEPLLDLQFVFNRAYDGGPYRRGAVDDSRPPDPLLSEPNAAWAEPLLGNGKPAEPG